MSDSTTPQDSAAMSPASTGSVANHGAAPAAIARTDADRNRTDKAALRLGEGAGNTPGEGEQDQRRRGGDDD